ncbi:Peroxisomal membrane signal receptor PTS1 [Lunasporangiospora selenospora]|uniref:Peroxisomal membrane signal receptor PTS1 n=1 Tax=Lunasporangiospora selenospora TaxID=979761 RepID=A0A9P6FQ62_9FUNG|nr:Peroxisomal membrane signal receptor PTS1 [Lunasporangiospora selenospora]
MSFQSMVSGGECASGSNAMRQFTKHFNQNTSLHQERFGNAPASAGPSMRTSTRPAMGGDDQQLLDEFFEHQKQHGDGGAFQFDNMHQELSAIHRPPGFEMAPPGADWSQEFHQQGPAGPRIFEMNPEEEAAFSAAFQQHQVAPHEWQEEYLQREHVVGEMPAEFEAAFQKNFDWANEFALVEGKGKGRAVELNHATWEAEFEAAQSASTANATALDFDNDREQLEDLWNTLKDNLTDTEDIQNILDDPKSWETEFSDLSTVATPQLGPYSFELNNPYLTHPDPMAEGVRLMEQGGSLSEAALAFEAAVQKDENNSQAWMMLGNVQAQNEKEEPAIRALERAVQVDPKNLDAYMNLAVSYTNEGYDHQAYLTLERWLATKYPDVVASNGPTPAHISSWETHARVTDLYLQAVRNAAENAVLDADLQVGLGVLFYGSGDYDKAVDCFTAGLKVRPNDYLLWNRLGATLANSGKSEDAIEAYHRALEIKPSFVRARYNLGVSCINIGCHKEAVEHLLGALSMHQGDGDGSGANPGAGGEVNVSGNLWETLRRTFIMMGRSDLAERAVAGADINQFRNEFEF